MTLHSAVDSWPWRWSAVVRHRPVEDRQRFVIIHDEHITCRGDPSASGPFGCVHPLTVSRPTVSVKRKSPGYAFRAPRATAFGAGG